MLKFDEVILLGCLIVCRTNLLLRISNIILILMDNGIGSCLLLATSLQQVIQILKGINKTIVMFISQDLVVKHLVSNLIRKSQPIIA